MNFAGYILSAVAVLSLLGGVFGVGFVKGIRNEADRHAEFRREVGVASERVRLENERLLGLAQRNAAEVKAGYSRALADLDRDYASRLAGVRRDHTGAACAVSTDAGATGGTDAAAQEPGPGAAGEAPQFTEFEAACFALERDAAADALQLIWLQEWAARMHEAQQPGGAADAPATTVVR